MRPLLSERAVRWVVFVATYAEEQTERDRNVVERKNPALFGTLFLIDF